MALTIGGLFTEARRLLSDDDKVRWSDADLVAALNDALLQARMKRPDAFIEMGLRNQVPQYVAPEDLSTPWPLDPVLYPAFLYYVVGRSELREDVASDEDRSVVLMNKFTNQLLNVLS